ncbi:hypothetical protein HK100_009608 [Physocladia obscura]|uniref:Uncharacterized protein n=1 Tax=Physocladia obscura TaxID=109957 RepID=A0AAD5XF19_9FUNG|nr:hypothetical protein HK100_009608 [Physocladia obscura]
MSAEQFAEYSLEPCILDYNTIFQNTKVVSSPEDSPISTADDPMMSDSSQPLPTPPPPRPNVFPHYYKRNRGRLPTRPGALDAFLVVSCGVLQRRLAMYPTTFLEDQMLLRQITDSMTARYEEWLVANKGGQSNKMDGTVSSAVGGGSGGDANAAECNSRQPYQGAKEDNDAGNDAEFEDRKRRKSENPAKNSTSPNDDYESGGTGEANSMDCEDVTSNGGDESVGTGSAGGADGNDDGTMKVAQSDDTLVSVESGGQINVDAGGVIAKSGTRDKQIANAAAQPKPVRQLPRIILPSVPIKSAVASAPGPTKPATIKPQAQLGWYTSNRIVAIRFRQQEKRSLLTALKFLETMVEKRYASFLLDNNLITSQAERQAKEILVMGGAGAGVQVSPAVFAAANAAAAATAAAAAGVGRNYEVSEEEGEEEEEEEEEMDEVRRDAMADVLEEFEDEEEDDEEGYYYSGSEFGSEYST